MAVQNYNKIEALYRNQQCLKVPKILELPKKYRFLIIFLKEADQKIVGPQPNYTVWQNRNFLVKTIKNSANLEPNQRKYAT